MSKPRVNTNPVANRYSAMFERIIEYTNGEFGGLISLRTRPDGTLHVGLYRHDPEVRISAPIKVLVLTVDHGNGIHTSLHREHGDVIAALRGDYDPGGEWAETSDEDIIQTLIDMQGLVIYIDEQEVPA